MANRQKKVILVVVIMIPIAFLHFVTGENYGGPFPVFFNGFLLDILLPMGFYLLLCLIDNVILQSWLIKGLLVFGAAATAELLQWSGIEFLGSTYDPWDFVMYGLGVALAIGLDLFLFPRLFTFWKSETGSIARTAE